MKLRHTQCIILTFEYYEKECIQERFLSKIGKKNDTGMYVGK